MKCPLTRTWANFISHRARRDISQCAPAHYFTFCGSKTFHHMHLCPQMQCLSRKKDEEFLQFFVLFLLVGASFFHTALSQAPLSVLFVIIRVVQILRSLKKSFGTTIVMSIDLNSLLSNLRAKRTLYSDFSIVSRYASAKQVC